ncbi:SDR family oxidoreductase [Sporosarcina sp. Marseille-Q4943]|uniref:SDR family oxidoreductase n=1 Tax=Sporosarcina sp. Marseille-Q4943 TaxID=2942204 RepID=UPI00208DC77C|nr:SDR family oxidoreductase [Sporosarcina sp. Marseille-Q4943]
MRTHFFTGFPGFIATELIKELIRQDEAEKIYVLVLQHEAENAQQKIRDIMKEVGEEVPVEIIIGDITEPDLALSKESLSEIRRFRLTIWHLAAIYDLAVKPDIAWKVNVEGTRRVNEFVEGHPLIDRYMYFSTAYVAGLREGLLLETELIRPEAFKNHYEETKFEAELLVEDLKSKKPTTVIRPGIVRGHSVTGETIKFDGPYFFMNMIDRLRWLPFIPYVGKTQSRINVVPVDYILKASIYLSSKEEAVGMTVHLTDPSPHPVEEVFRAMTIALTGRKPKGRVPQKIVELALTPTLVQRKLGVEIETLDYLHWNSHFDTSVAEKLLGGSLIVCPDFIKTIPSMAKYYEKHKRNINFHIKIGE